MRGTRTRTSMIWIATIAILVCWASSPALAQVSVDIDIAGTANVGATLTATANVSISNGSTVQSYQWMQLSGAPAGITAPTSRSTQVKLGNRLAYRRHAIMTKMDPPVTQEDLPENVEIPEGFPGGIANTFQVVGFNPFTLEEAAVVHLRVIVTTTSGNYAADVEIHTNLPWGTSTSLRNVPVGQAVVLFGKEQATYNWTINTPDGSNARLQNRLTRWPEFFPDVPGVYTIRVRDLEAGERLTFEIYAGYWDGVIVGIGDDGRPLTEPVCNSCHIEGGLAGEDTFADWRQTGHAEILTNNLNTSTHYGPNCFACHAVGFDPMRNNFGFDEEEDYGPFLNAGLLNNPSPDNFETMFELFPELARKSNIQCENCHGPHLGSEGGFDSDAHGLRIDTGDEPRTSLSADVCATCHGEPLRHARYQQWQLSGHANYELAFDEGGSGNCARCHTANGFLEWLPILLGEEEGDPTASISVNWEPEESHPQTCQTCHDPHQIGTTTGNDTNATVRVSGHTPNLIAGFQVNGAGKGAVCMTCHNSRRGLRNDATYDPGDAARAPHGSAQTDVLMGENAYGVNVGVRGRHSLLEDTCVTCHMSKTPPPDVLSYNQGGTNHTFAARSEVCSECHVGLDNADSLTEVIEAVSDDVKGLIEAAISDLIDAQIAAGSTINLNGEAILDSPSDYSAVEFTEYHGRQALLVTVGGEVLGPFRMNDIDVMQPGPLPTVALYDLADEDLPKAGWNWTLIHNDGSHGAHNPTYALTVLDAARDFLGGQGGPRAELPFSPVDLELK